MKVAIYGERCSGTTYLQELLLLNFDVELTSNYGWKHFFGFHDLSSTEDVVFIGIIRNLQDWINSLYREKHHLPEELTKNVDSFLTSPFYSIDNGEIMEDRHIQTHERYKNIFELRLVKNKFLMETMYTKVKHYHLIVYEELCGDFKYTMSKLASILPIKHPEFPVNVTYYKQYPHIEFVKKKNEISYEQILPHVNKQLLFYEDLLSPNL